MFMVHYERCYICNFILCACAVPIERESHLMLESVRTKATEEGRETSYCTTYHYSIVRYLFEQFNNKSSWEIVRHLLLITQILNTGYYLVAAITTMAQQPIFWVVILTAIIVTICQSLVVYNQFFNNVSPPISDGDAINFFQENTTIKLIPSMM